MNDILCPYCSIPPHKPPKQTLICPVCGRVVPGVISYPKERS